MLRWCRSGRSRRVDFLAKSRAESCHCVGIGRGGDLAMDWVMFWIRLGDSWRESDTRRLMWKFLVERVWIDETKASSVKRVDMIAAPALSRISRETVVAVGGRVEQRQAGGRSQKILIGRRTDIALLFLSCSWWRGVWQKGLRLSNTWCAIAVTSAALHNCWTSHGSLQGYIFHDYSRSAQ